MVAKRGGLASILVIVGVSLTFLGSPVGAAAHHQSSNCTHYVDNSASFDGDGSQSRPWDSIADHVDDLSPGDVMCIRGDQSAPGRVYNTSEISLDHSGTASQPITIQPYANEKVIIRNSASDKLLVFNGVQYWVVQGFTLDQNNRGSRAIVFREDASHNILRNSEIRNGKTDGIVIASGATDNVIENNHIHDFFDPNLSRDAHCILVQINADDTMIRGNTIHDCSGDGVQLLETGFTSSADFSDNVQIIHNTFYRGTLVRAESAVAVKAATNLKVANNVMSGYFDHSPITVVKASEDTLFESNVIYDSLRGFNVHTNEGGVPERLTIRNNLIFNIVEYGIQVSGVENGTFVHNTIVNVGEHAFRVVLAGLRGGRIQNNLFVNSGSVQLKDAVIFRDVSVGHNGWFATEADSVFTASSDIVGGSNPGFVDAGSDDYHLTSTSPARDAGINVGVTTDFEDEPRPWGGQPDMGADEYLPVLYLTAVPGDRRIRLSWTEFDHPDLVSYAIIYTPGPGGSDAEQGPSPILGIPPSTREYILTGLTNFVPYVLTVAARDGNQADLDVSNRLIRIPTDIFVFMPLTLRR